MDVVAEKLKRICRVCLLEDTVMFSIVHGNCRNLQILSMIMRCTSIKISAEDEMPELLCSNCLQRLETAYSFIQECEQSDVKLREMIANMNNLKLKHPETFLLNLTDPPETEISPESEIDCEKMVKIELDVIEDEEVSFVSEETDKKKIRKRKQIIPQKKINGIYPCHMCTKSFMRHKRLWKHSKIHPFFRCYICFQMFTSLDPLLEHEKEKHTDKIYSCSQDDCAFTFTDCRAFINHKKQDHEMINFIHCSKCEDKSFDSHESWDLHLQKHVKVQTRQRKFTGEFKCNQCNKKYATANKLQIHKFSHTLIKPYVCNDCGKKFVHKYNMNRHINVTHKGMKPPKREKTHLCPHCGQTFARPADLTTHIRGHSGIKPFACDHCEYRCHDKKLLASHLRTHTGLRPYKCSYCEKAFGSRSYLTIHERYHSGERPYVCPSCQKGFTNSKDLKVHERTHTGVKLFSCGVCNNTFTTLHYLRVHTKKHEGQ